MKITAAPLGSYQANCYLIADEEAKLCALIDPGDQPDVVENMIAQSGCALAFIALTHGHMDHMGAVPALLKNHPGVPVYRHPGDDGAKTGFAMFPAMDADRLQDIQDGDVLGLGSLGLTVLHTPGHSLGSVVFQLGDVLFTGDTLFAGSMGRTDFEGGSYAQIMASLKRLALLPGDYQVCAGHMGMSTLEKERKTNYYLMEALGG